MIGSDGRTNPPDFRSGGAGMEFAGSAGKALPRMLARVALKIAENRG